MAEGGRTPGWWRRTFAAVASGRARERRWWIAAAVLWVLAALLLVLAAEAVGGGANAVRLQLAGDEELFGRHLANFGGPDALASHLRRDVAFVLAAALAAVALAVAARAARGTDRRRLPGWAWAAGAVPFAADLAENALLEVARRRTADGVGLGDLPAWIETVALLKWVAYAALVGALAVAVYQRLRYPSEVPAPDVRPGVDDAHRAWGEAAAEPTVGIALSGGGIRSAAFALGGLAALGNDRVRSARYLSAASGGAYLAGAMTLQAQRQFRDGDETELPFHQGSPELERLRAKSSYLALHGGRGRIGFFHALARIAFNLLVLWLVVFGLARPVGWLVSSGALHPELRARSPLIQSADLDRDVTPDDLAVTAEGDLACPGGVTGRRYLVEVADARIETRVGIDRTHGPERRARVIPVSFRPAEVHLCGATLGVGVQPRATVVLGDLAASDDRADDPTARPLVEVTRELRLGLDGDDGIVAFPAGGTEAEQVQARLHVDRQPRFEQHTGYRGRAAISIDGWMWAVSLGALAIAGLWAAIGRRGSTLQLGGISSAGLAIAAAVGVVTVVLPWILHVLPGAADRVLGLLPGAPDAEPGEPRGFLAWIAALLAAGQAVRTMLARAQPRQSLARRSSQLVLKVAAFALLVTAGAVLVLAVVQQGALNGPDGRLASLRGYWWGFGEVPDAARWAGVVALLAALALWRPAHHWSFMPLYRDRLAEAFSLTGETISSTRQREDPSLLRLSDCRGREVPEEHRPAWPELVICAAVNINDTDPANPVPAGRWADSFTFSPTEIGGPTVGYLPTRDYEDALGPRRSQKELSVASLVAVSGAAFSPAMGKMGLGPIGGLLALLNLRLGLWLPHPGWVRATGTPPAWPRRATWPYLLREVVGEFHRNAPFLYVTDGGHWENLGLVELFRRRCTEIYVLSAAGDGTWSFATVAEALALAREQCGIDVHIDLSPLRPPPGDAAPPPARQLLRRGTSERPQAEPVAPSTHAVGWFAYPDGTRGRILVAETAITADLPWDVHAWAESSPVFPDDPTSDQSFDHRQFESYRKLGEHQLSRGIEDPVWRAAGDWAAGALSDADLRSRVAVLAGLQAGVPAAAAASDGADDA